MNTWRLMFQSCTLPLCQPLDTFPFTFFSLLLFDCLRMENWHRLGHAWPYCRFFCRGIQLRVLISPWQDKPTQTSLNSLAIYVTTFAWSTVDSSFPTPALTSHWTQYLRVIPSPLESLLQTGVEGEAEEEQETTRSHEVQSQTEQFVFHWSLSCTVKPQHIRT